MEAMRADLAAHTAELRHEQERGMDVRERLAQETAAREQIEGAHSKRVMELQRRLRDEHTLRGTAEAELRSMRAQVAALKQKVQAAIGEQGRAAQLALDLEGERRQHSEARHQLSSAENRLESETAARQKLSQAHSELEALVSKLSERNSKLGIDLHSREREASIAQGRMAQLEAQLQRAQDTGEADRAALQAARGERASEQAHEVPTLLQAESERTRKSLHKAEHDVERLRRALDRSEEQHRSAETRAAAATQSLQALQSSAASAQAKLDELRVKAAEELGAARADAEAARSQQQELQDECQALRERGTRQSRELLQLREESAELGRLRDTVRAAEAQAQEAAHTREALGALKAQFVSYADLLEDRERDIAKRDMKTSLVPRCMRNPASFTEAAPATLICGAWQVRELADMLRSVSERLSTVQTAADGERSRLEHTVQDLEGRLRHAQSTAGQLRDSAEAAERGRSKAVSQLSLVQDEVSRLKSELANEQARCTKLRAEVSTTSVGHVKELENKARVMEDVLAAMQAEERAKLDAQHEARVYRARLAELELTLTDSHTAKQRAEEAFSSSQAAVSTLKRKATAYKKENKQLVSQYDAWLKTLMQQRHSGAASLPLHDTEFSS
eukprot:jgi/Astpho2/5567/Aster-02825